MKKISLPISRENFIASLAVQTYWNPVFASEARNTVSRIYREGSHRLVMNPQQTVQLFKECQRVWTHKVGRRPNSSKNRFDVRPFIREMARKGRSKGMEWSPVTVPQLID